MATETYVWTPAKVTRDFEVYQADGTEPANIYMYDSGTAVEIWPSSRLVLGACYPDPPPSTPNNTNWAAGGKLPLQAEGWDRWGTGGNANTYNKVNASPSMHDCFYMLLDSPPSLSAPASYEYIGLSDEWAVHNTHSLSWTTGTNTSTLHLGMYFSAYSNYGGTNLPRNFAYAAPTHSNQGWDGFQEDDNYLGWYSPVACLYGDRIQTGEATHTINRVTSGYVYWDVNGIESYNVPLASCESGKYLRINKNSDSTGSYIMVDYRIADYNQTSADYLESCRILIGITRNSYGPGTEKLVTCMAVDLGDSQYRYWQPFCGEINFSDTPGDQSTTTIVSGESITFRIYKDLT